MLPWSGLSGSDSGIARPDSDFTIGGSSNVYPNLVSSFFPARHSDGRSVSAQPLSRLDNGWKLPAMVYPGLVRKATGFRPSDLDAIYWLPSGFQRRAICFRLSGSRASTVDAAESRRQDPAGTQHHFPIMERHLN